MKAKISHEWNVSPKEAIQIQNNLKKKLVTTGKLKNVSKVAGVDVGFKNNFAYAAIAILGLPDLNLIEYTLAEKPVEFPYIPGLLAFREGPPVLAAFEKVTKEPDLIIFDAHGYSHPRRFGLASHLGMLLDKPSIGCAKSKLRGEFKNLGNSRGQMVDLEDKNEIIGKVVRTKDSSPPIFISVGHKISLGEAIKFTLLCTKYKNRLPETTIFAHNIASGKIPPKSYENKPQNQKTLFDLNLIENP